MVHLLYITNYSKMFKGEYPVVLLIKFPFFLKYAYIKVLALNFLRVYCFCLTWQLMNIYRCEDLMLEPALEFGIILNGILRKEPLLQNLDSDAPERIAGVKDFMQKLKAENVCSELNDIIERRTK